MFWGCREASVDKELTIQVQGPEFRYPEPLGGQVKGQSSVIPILLVRKEVETGSQEASGSAYLAYTVATQVLLSINSKGED